MTGLRLIMAGGAVRELRGATGIARQRRAQLHLADDGAEALELARSHGADLLLADLTCDVPALLAALRHERITVPVLACSLSSDAVRRMAAEPASLEGLVGCSVEEVERALILQTLARCRGNRTGASAMLGISVRTLRNKLRAFQDDGFAIAPAA